MSSWDGDFVAIDFETADHGRNSACAVALVRVEGNRIVKSENYLIRPPRKKFIFSHIHGITWQDVVDSPSFAELWPRLSRIMKGVDFLAAHWAPFDRSVLNACCKTSRMQPPDLPFVCTVALARKVWSICPTNLPSVCQHLGIHLKHHDPVSDAEACAKVILAARRKR